MELATEQHFMVRELVIELFAYLSTKLDSLTGMPLPNKIRQGQLVDLYLSNTPPPKDSITNPSIKN
jgi:hypothetical protein